jgi:hypothetical protein
MQKALQHGSNEGMNDWVTTGNNHEAFYVPNPMIRAGILPCKFWNT